MKKTPQQFITLKLKVLLFYILYIIPRINKATNCVPCHNPTCTLT